MSDEIDDLVDASLAACRQDNYMAPFPESCELCGFQWHGTTGTGMYDGCGSTGEAGCPGAYATDEQREEWLGKQ